MLAVGMEVAGQDARPVAGFEHHGTRAVAEQNAGGAIGEIEQARKHFGPDHQGPVGRTALDHGIGHGQGVDEAAADRLDVERRAARGAQLVLQQRGGGGKHHVGRRRCHDDEIQIVGLQSCCRQGALRGFERQVAAADIGRSEMTRVDARPLHDPLI